MTMEYKADAKNCELCHPEGICCYCKNIPCYELEKEIDNLNGTIDNLIALQLDLYETLSEIKKEIDYVNSHTCGEDKRAVALHNILQKISEVEK